MSLEMTVASVILKVHTVLLEVSVAFVPLEAADTLGTGASPDARKAGAAGGIFQYDDQIIE